MNMTKWLNSLAASYTHYSMTKLQNFEYGQELEKWPLSPDEWLELKTLARRRHPSFFPTIGELEEIMHEVKRNAAGGKNGKPGWETFVGPDGLIYARRPK